MEWVINDWAKLEIQIKPDFGMQLNRIEWDESFGRICSYKFHINVCEWILHVQFGWFATCHCIHLKHLLKRFEISHRNYTDCGYTKQIVKLKSSISNSAKSLTFIWILCSKIRILIGLFGYLDIKQYENWKCSRVTTVF